MEDRHYYKAFAEQEGYDPKLVHKVMQNVWLSTRQELLSRPDVCSEGFVFPNSFSFTIMKNIDKVLEGELRPMKRIMYERVQKNLKEHKKKVEKTQRSRRKKIAENPDRKLSKAMQRRIKLKGN